MKKTFTLLLLAILAFSGSLFAQEKCGTSAKKSQKLENPDIAKRVAELEVFTQDWIKNNSGNTKQAVVTLPVVVHVLYNNAVSNISDAQILSQFDILNDDFRKLNSNFGDTPAAFQGVAADTEIEFCLASIDPMGNETSGITRTQVPNDFDYENDYYDSDFGGKATWGNDKYINVWIGNLEEAGLLGFAYSPETTGDEDDGVVVTYTAWGNIGAVEEPNHLGRTATHEIGHYFNLDHVWGPEDGGCQEDDFVNDTPLQYEDSSGCDNEFPYYDDCTSNGNGVMFMNYMDYSDDACMTLFTQGQKMRMLAAVNGPRSGLLTSNGCNLMTNTEAVTDFSIHLFPNPAKSFLHIEATHKEQLQVELMDLNGQLIKSAQMAANEVLTSLPVNDLSAGIYLIKISSANHVFSKKVIISK